MFKQLHISISFGQCQVKCLDNRNSVVRQIMKIATTDWMIKTQVLTIFIDTNTLLKMLKKLLDPHCSR